MHGYIIIIMQVLIIYLHTMYTYIGMYCVLTHYIVGIINFFSAYVRTYIHTYVGSKLLVLVILCTEVAKYRRITIYSVQWNVEE